MPRRRKTVHSLKRELMAKLSADPNHWRAVEVLSQIRAYAAYRLFLDGSSFGSIVRNDRINSPWDAERVEREVRAVALRAQNRRRG